MPQSQQEYKDEQHDEKSTSRLKSQKTDLLGKQERIYI